MLFAAGILKSDKNRLFLNRFVNRAAGDAEFFNQVGVLEFFEVVAEEPAGNGKEAAVDEVERNLAVVADNIENFQPPRRQVLFF